MTVLRRTRLRIQQRTLTPNKKLKTFVATGFHIINACLLYTSLFLILFFTPQCAIHNFCHVCPSCLIVQFLTYLEMCIRDSANALRGIADVKPMMYIAFIAYFLISLPAGYFFGFIKDWGIIGICMAFPFGLTTAGILYYLRFNRDTKLK